ncbi:MAG: hypothetical protein AABZ15_17275 [Nitrospirota bacterium]
MPMPFAVPYGQSGLATLYIILTRDADGYYVVDAAGACQAAAPASWPSLTEDAVKKGRYTLTVSALNNGWYTGMIYKRLNAAQDPAVDEAIALVTKRVESNAFIQYPSEAALATVASYIDTEITAIIAALATLQTVGGVITALVDIGAEISSALLPIVMEKGEKLIIQVEVLEGGVAKDCTGFTAKFGVKEKLTDTTYKIGLLDGVFSNNALGVKSILTFTILPAATTGLAAFGGLYSAAIYDGGGNKAPIADRGGVAFTLKEDILDV